MAMKPKQLISLERGSNSKSTLIFHEKALEDVLTKVGTSRVALISATGSARSGKSYLLNYVLRYLSWEQDEDGDWMGWSNNSTALKGFEWRGGKNAVTSGIWIWPEPLMAKTSGGKAIALLLIDTQGTLNEFTTEEESIAITAICLLMSSITIYNVKNDIEHENFQLIKKSLQLCSEIRKNECDSQDLLFTIRDWKKDNGFDFGTENGKQLLKGKLEVNPGITEEARICKELINGSFKNLNCILFPDPGEKVKSLSHKGFLAEVNPLFSTVLEEIPATFDVNNLYRNSVARNSMEFMALIQKFIKKFNGQQINPVIAQKSNATHLKAFEMYKESFEKHSEKFYSADDVKAVHDTALQTSLKYLEEENCEISYKAMVELQSEFQTVVEDYYLGIIMESDKRGKELQEKTQNASIAVMDTYTDEMKSVFSKDTISEKHINLKHGIVKEDVLTSFIGLIPKKYRHLNLGIQIQSLEREIDENFAEMKKLWESRKEARGNSQWEFGRPSAIQDYKRGIKELIGGLSYVEADSLRQYHEKIQMFVLNKHCSSYDYGDSVQKFQMQLKNDLNQIFLELDKTNNDKIIEAIEGKLEKSLAIAVGKYKQELATVEPTEDVELTEEIFLQKIDEAKDKIKTQFITDISLESDHNKAEFLNKLNSEVERQRAEAIAKFQSTRKTYAAIVGEKKKEIELELINIVENHSKSLDILTAKNTEELGKKLFQRSIDIYDRIKADNKVPSKMLVSAQKETMELIERKMKDVTAKGETKIDEYNRKVNNLVQECLRFYKTKMNNLEDIDSEDLLHKRHVISLKDCVLELKNKCAVKDENWLQPFIETLEKNIESYYDSEVKKVFLFEMGQLNLQLRTALMDVTKSYREAMDDYFRKTPFTTPSELFVYHSKLCTKVCNEVATKSKLTSSQKEQLIRLLDKDYKTYENRNKMNTPTNDPAIGIDLGTTYTCVAIYENGKARVIPNEKGSFTFPSYIAFTPKGELVGHPAKEMAHIYPQNTIFDAKRLIGRRFDEEAVQRDIKNWPFEVVNDNNIPKIKVQAKNREKIIPPEAISAKILQHVKAIAERHLGKTIKKAVITVPAYFNDGQRQATKDAGEIAGLEVLQIINEPTAAAMAYHLNTKGVLHERNVLVYDLGGGTFDVVVLNMKPGGSIVVKSVNGDTHLGGEDFDDNLLEEMIKRYKNKHGVDLSAGKNSLKVDEKASTARVLRRLRNACEMTKINISGGINTNGEVNVEALVGTKDFLEPVTRKEFEDLNMDLFLKTLDVVGKSLKDAKLEKGDIHDIVLVGGSTRIPKVQEMLSEYFNDKTLQATVNPDEAVALGAAVQAAILNGNQEQILKNISLKDVTPLSLGIRVYGGGFSTIITRNTPLPANATEDYYTAADYVDEVEISIYEGEEKRANDNHLLGKFLLKGIPPKKKGEEKLLVKMEVDSEGILKVTAVCVSTGSKNNISIEDHRGRLTKDEKRALKEEFDGDKQ